MYMSCCMLRASRRGSAQGDNMAALSRWPLAGSRVPQAYLPSLFSFSPRASSPTFSHHITSPTITATRPTSTTFTTTGKSLRQHSLLSVISPRHHQHIHHVRKIGSSKGNRLSTSEPPTQYSADSDHPPTSQNTRHQSRTTRVWLPKLLPTASKCPQRCN
jgi:hypothetical protein